MRTIEITEANEWKQTLTDVVQSIQDKWAILGEQSEWDKRVYNEITEIHKKLEIIESEAKEVKSAEEVFNEIAKETMVVWHIEKFKRIYPTLYTAIIKAMEEYHAGFRVRNG
jgi:SepF-like predicted cell division protein (DUF552 family)